MTLPTEAVERFKECLESAIRADEIEPTAMCLSLIHAMVFFPMAADFSLLRRRSCGTLSDAF